jgi:UbiD family decarboxylase
MDLRESLALLEKEGGLRHVGAAVDWDREIGAIARRVLEKKGPALLFENIKGYETGRCTGCSQARSATGPGSRSPSALPQTRRTPTWFST